MSLKRRADALEKVAGPFEEIDGPINIPEFLSGERDEELRRELGRVEVYRPVISFRDAWAQRKNREPIRDSEDDEDDDESVTWVPDDHGDDELSKLIRERLHSAASEGGVS